MSSVAIESHVEPDHCPWCGSVISRRRFAEIEARIAEKERQRLAEERKRLTKEFKEREASLRADAVTRATTLANAEAEKKIAALRTIREQDLSKIKELQADKTRRQKEIEGLRSQLAQDFERRLDASNKQHAKDIEQIRGALSKDRDSQISKIRSEQAREKELLQGKIDGLARQLQRKTADELGDGAEVDVYERLRDAFPYDQIERIKRGMPGADISHRVLHKGKECGTILLDSKNRQGWQNGYVTKLREDQVAAKADHAILTTTVFPSGTKELCVDNDTKVVVVNPARVVEIVGILRTGILRSHALDLSSKQRAEKRELLYRYMTSAEFQQHLSEAERLTNDVLGLEVDEKRAHDKVWEKRGKMVTRLRNVMRQIDTEVSAALEGRAGNASSIQEGK